MKDRGLLTFLRTTWYDDGGENKSIDCSGY